MSRINVAYLCIGLYIEYVMNIINEWKQIITFELN